MFEYFFQPDSWQMNKDRLNYYRKLGQALNFSISFQFVLWVFLKQGVLLIHARWQYVQLTYLQHVNPASVVPVVLSFFATMAEKLIVTVSTLF